jgi:hypothetical protein
MSKLYTEEQVIELTKAAYSAGENHNKFIFKMELDKITPIQLPTDEEIKDKSNKLGYGSSSVGIVQKNFQLGAIWMRDKIKGS